jgi:prephenate dehydrogenase
MFAQLGLIGCGMMGGSFAMALRRAGLVRRIIGYSKSPSTTERARRMGVIDDAAESALLAVSGSDIVLLAVPVAATESTLRAIRHLVEPGVLVRCASAFPPSCRRTRSPARKWPASRRPTRRCTRAAR